ncbi:chondroitin sulfate proteoglycan 5-like isoform X3 [Gambusia affinis]|uniref:chondroitin sulfate proteoglycan 5-like isoform X3 n=1 Tax=Gambusia affinis TaxID=33528 RepID=UPI001CDBCA9F|nr:chondroitin sulfate proteoglycan 5-like isoform X3 [Gambusia affinis]
MACRDSRLGTWQVLLTISMFIIPLCAHNGHHSLARRHPHHNHSSVHKEALDTRMVLSDDSAEREHLIGAGIGARLPLGSTRHHHSHKRHYLDFVEEDQHGEELTAGGAGPDHPGNPLSDDVITVAFHSPAPDVVPADVTLDWAKTPKAQKQRGGEPNKYSLTEYYDYLSSDNDVSAVDTTPEPEPTPSPPPDMEDENPLLAGSPVIRKNSRPNTSGGSSLPAPPMQGPDNNNGMGVGGAVGADGCRLGFVLSGPGVCVSQCDIEPNFCFNGGLCTVVAGMGAFCRCNIQDYIWNKGLRCEWAVTEFQVLCVVVAVACFVFLLLFMIIVFFAKSLYRLKNENMRLRKRSKYRPQSSEPQTDGLSVSTTADGSQPNVRKLCDTPPPAPQAHTHNLAYYDNIICQDEPQKKENQAKSPQPKEEGSMNILNSHSPKHENNRPASVVHGHTPNNTEENTEDGVTIGLEVLLPKEAKLHQEVSPPLQYDVFLYKVANNGDSTSHGQGAPSNSSVSQPVPKSPKTPKSPKLSASGRHSSPSRHSLSGRHPSPSRHPAPGCHSSPTCHPNSPHASSQQKCLPGPSATPPQQRSPRGGPPNSERSARWRDHQSGPIHSSPSSPHLTQLPPSPSRAKCSAVSTRSLPPLS